jgi:hypothetical protein
MKYPKNLPRGTYCSDTNAKYTVSTMGGPHGSGIFGYYSNEFDAHRVKRWLLNNGATTVVVEDYDPEAPLQPGMHAFVELSLKGYS